MYIIPSFWNTVGQYEVIDTVRSSCVFIYLSDKVAIQGCINNRYSFLWTKEFFSHILIKQSRKYSGSNKYECPLSEARCLLYCACCFTRNGTLCQRSKKDIKTWQKLRTQHPNTLHLEGPNLKEFQPNHGWNEIFIKRPMGYFTHLNNIQLSRKFLYPLLHFHLWNLEILSILSQRLIR